ncbi:MAG: anhydro-N-acetylmuramic acid kinase [Pseudomonadota bacterium]
MSPPPVWSLGAMSGTSMDGVDAALLHTDGIDVFAFGRSDFQSYDADARTVLRNALGQSSGPDCEAAAKVVETAHIDLLGQFPEAELIGFHGQTVHHAPDDGQTVQVGDGQRLADALEKPVVWDFRTADVRLGGQGAPLAPFYHFALAKHLGFSQPVAFLNIGGVGNLTWLDPSAAAPETDGATLAFDTGPGNALIDDLCLTRLGQHMDKDGDLTLAGRINDDVLHEMLSGTRYFAKIPPKSLDRNDFIHWAQLVAPLDDADAIATLAAGTAGAVAKGIEHCPTPPSRILVAGGGRKNKGLMEMIEAIAPCPVVPVEAHDLDGDMLEAQAFAYLAVRVKRGLPTTARGTTGVPTPVGGGQISQPHAQRPVA